MRHDLRHEQRRQAHAENDSPHCGGQPQYSNEKRQYYPTNMARCGMRISRKGGSVVVGFDPVGSHAYAGRVTSLDVR